MQFSNRISTLQPSIIREILKAPESPDIISFAAGNPSPQTFPTADMACISADIYASQASQALQYGISEGFAPLREQTAAYLKNTWKIGNAKDELIITSGGQQAIELAAKVLCNEGDIVLCEESSFVGALNAFRSYNLQLVGVAMDGNGMDMIDLAAKLQATRAKVIYTIPTFHNPCGTVLPVDPRTQMLSLAEQYGATIIEDSPYCELRYEGVPVPPLKSMDDSGRVIYCGSYSKTIAPGIRVGYAVARHDIITKMTVAKQVSDVHTNLFFQHVVSRFLDECDFNAHIKACCQLYGKRRDALVKGLQALDGIEFVKPCGGLFLWLKLPEGKAALDICAAAKANKVLCVPGNAFAIDEGVSSNFIRLNFSMPDEVAIEKGVKRLAGVL
ncbi:MAG: PLP-dependent aminotransferase family protein [Oscillospiraceae bacterium]|nr:PLP-dependent aminotransferase family protein [Oscillospiraceae bacterium]